MYTPENGERWDDASADVIAGPCPRCLRDGKRRNGCEHQLPNGLGYVVASFDVHIDNGEVFMHDNDCVDHWHCDAQKAAHMCDGPNRLAPCPTCGEKPALDTRRIETLALDRPDVLNAVAKLVGIHLETVNPDRVCWYATPRGAGTFSGTLAEVSAFVRGYAIACTSAQPHERSPQ